MSRTLLIACAVAAVAGAALWFVIGPRAAGREDERSAQPSTRIYGATATREPSAGPASATRDEAVRVARAWAAAWTRLTNCPMTSPQSLDRVLKLSTGAIRDTLEASPPRPTAAAAARPCSTARLKRVEVHRVPGGWYAIAVRKGDGLRPLRLRLRPVDDGKLRVASIDF